MVDKELIEIWRNMLKPSISSLLLKTNYEGMGEQDKEEFERDFDEILDLALIGLKHKAQLSLEGTTKDATSSTADTISRQTAIDALNHEYRCGDIISQCGIEVAIDIISELPTIQPVATDTNVGDTISRQAAVELAMEYCPDDDGTVQCDGDIRELLDELENLPPAQPERKKGKWVKIPGMNEYCSACNRFFPLSYFQGRPFEINYCPHCGAKMEEKQNE